MVLLLLAAALVGRPWSASAQYAEQEPEEHLAQVLARATAIAEGKAIGQESFLDATGRSVYTISTVVVYKVFKGAVADTIQLVVAGGMAGGVAMGLIDGPPMLGLRQVAMLFLVPFTEAVLPFAVPADQVYRAVEVFDYHGLPPNPNAAYGRYNRYYCIETSLYPLLAQRIGQPYREVRPFDIERYNRVLERRNLDSQVYQRADGTKYEQATPWQRPPKADDAGR